jgi:hypothetical protein
MGKFFCDTFESHQAQYLPARTQSGENIENRLLSNARYGGKNIKIKISTSNTRRTQQ